MLTSAHVKEIRKQFNVNHTGISRWELLFRKIENVASNVFIVHVAYGVEILAKDFL